MDSTQEILEIFEQVAAVPRASGHEERIAAWLLQWAANHGFAAEEDPAGNLRVRVPASPGCEAAPIVVLQGHLDMVCEKTPDSTHDFSSDPIRCIVEGEWMHADRTTLGADNGIGIALAMALAVRQDVIHPRLELLFTVAEELGIDGASKLEPGFLQGRILLNLDSEHEGTFIVGCAGGQTTRLELPLPFEPISAGRIVRITVSSLQGGHSGADIHKHRANAHKVLARFLGELENQLPFRLAEWKGGTAHNAIPREAQATILVVSDHRAVLETSLQEFGNMLREEFSLTEPSLNVSLEAGQAARALSPVGTEKVVDLLQALPHGVAGMSSQIEGLVETSNNLAVVDLADERLHILSSQRSTRMSQLNEHTRRIEAIGRLAGAEVATDSGYPAWQPSPASPLLGRARDVYERIFNTPPRVETIHAGLECGTIGNIFPGMDMLSLGATIRNAHSPAESLHLPSVQKVWLFLVETLASFCQD